MNRVWIALAATTLIVPAYAQAPAQQESKQPQSKVESASEVRVSAATKDFVEHAAVGNMYEIQSSRLVLDKVHNREFQDFGKRIVDDHTKSTDELKSITQPVTGLELPTDLDDKHKKMIDQLRSASATELAPQFKSQQIQAHQDAIKLYQDFAARGDNARLRQFAESTLPTLKEHLRLAQDLPDNPQIAQETMRDKAGAVQAQRKPADQRRAESASEAQGGQANAIIAQPGANHMLGSKLRGTTVYGSNDSNVGEINDIVLTTDGRVAAVVVGVGGFLGIGEKNVAIPFSKIDIRESRGSTTGMASQDRQNQPSGGPLEPQRIYLRDMTKQELEQAPSFKTGSK
ncbi:DUF4142 domain-containing protein [Bradyrhizobium sp. USDA 10063]